MNTRYIAEEYRLSHWAQIMQERKKSGLSIKAFCKNAGFHDNSYYYWQRKLREAAAQSIADNKAGLSEKLLVPSGWAICKTAVPETTKESLTIEIGEFKINTNPDVGPELLTKVCRVLKSLC